MKLLVCDRWDLDVEALSTAGWFLDWVVRSTTQASGHISRSWEVMWDLVESYGLNPYIVAEYFGGIGCHGLMVRELFPQAHRYMWEVSEEAFVHLKKTFPELELDKAIRHDDVYRVGPIEAEFQLCDFGDLTAFKMANGKHSKFLDGVFGFKPEAVMLTDTAGHFLHLHHDHYEKALEAGFEYNNYESYLQAVGQYVTRRWGYYPAMTAYSRWSAVTSYVPTPAVHIIQTMKDEPRGIEILEGLGEELL